MTEQTKRLDRLWAEHRFIPQTGGRETTTCRSSSASSRRTSRRSCWIISRASAPFRKRAEEFEKEVGSAAPRQLDALLDFAARAYRRPLEDTRKGRDPAVCTRRCARRSYRTTRRSAACWPACWCRRRSCSASSRRRRAGEARPVNDWELATRLSYFLWSSTPDEELRRLAAAGQLRDPKVLAAQVAADAARTAGPRRWPSSSARNGFTSAASTSSTEKNEKLFPTFDASLRKAIYEESILFFQDLFQSDRPVTGHPRRRLHVPQRDAGEALRHPRRRRAAVAARRGRAEVRPRRHPRAWRACRRSSRARRAPARCCAATGWSRRCSARSCRGRRPTCRSCPRRRRQRRPDDAAAGREARARRRVCRLPRAHRPVRLRPGEVRPDRPTAARRTSAACRSTPRRSCKDGTEFEGIDGLRDYLLTKKKDVIVRLFCRGCSATLWAGR